MSSLESFGLLGNLLLSVEYGIILFNNNEMSFINTEGEKILQDFPGLLDEVIAFNSLRSKMLVEGRVSPNFRNEFHLLDRAKHERYIDIEVVNRRSAQLFTLVDTTEQRLSGLIDELTKLGNRAMFSQKLSSLRRRTCVYPVSIIEGDLNGLKLTNDVFGHSIGDNLLTEMALILTSSVRGGTDVVCRWGGDEFAILLPNTSSEAAQIVCNRINKHCAESNCVPIPPSISLGHATQLFSEEPLEDVLGRAEAAMYSCKVLEAAKHRHDIMQTLKNLMVIKSSETIQHCERMAKLVVEYGKHLGLSVTDQQVLSDLAHFHDIGNAALPDEVLRFKGIYTEQMRKQMQQHVIAGFMAVKAVPEYVHLSTPILQHHENWDGSGYPNGIEGGDIHLLARIISIMDAYERITARISCASEGHATAIEEIKSMSGKKYDPELVAKFLEIHERFADIS